MKDTLFCIRYLLTLGSRVDRTRLVIGAGLLLLGALGTPVVAIALGSLVDDITAGAAAGAVTWAIVAAVALVAELMLGHFAHLYYFELSELTDDRLNRDLLRLVNGTVDIDRCEDPAFADQVALLREDILEMRTTVQSALQFIAITTQIMFTAILLAVLSPPLIALPLVAVIPVLLGARAERAIDRVREAQSSTVRRIHHIRRLATNPATQKEVRISGSVEYLLGRQRELLRQHGAAMAGGHRKQALFRSIGQSAFGLGYVGAVTWVLALAARGAIGLGDVVLVVTLATQVSVQMSSGLQLLGLIQRSAAGLRRFVALTGKTSRGDGQVRSEIAPVRVTSGLELDGVSFTYPGSTTPALREVSMFFPAGTSVALVGENGAGKTTLLTLLLGLRRPGSGRMLLDGVDLAFVNPEQWRARASALLQDYARVELTAQHSIGIGYLPEVNSPVAVRAAAGRADAMTVIDQLAGLDSLIGKGYGDGHELSGGQWQRIALARTVMRTEPLLVTLDEPSAALDAAAEQRLVDSYRSVARDVGVRFGGVTFFVTHRLSTVRLADVIVFMEQGRAVERGSHEELMELNGRYAELYRAQSRAYRES